MKLKKISIKNNVTGWNAKEIVFDDYLTLFVGASGVGKTQILRAVKDISSIAKGGSINGLEWDVTFVCSNKTYQWRGRFATADEDKTNYFKKDRQGYTVRNESLLCGEQVIINRLDEQIRFRDKLTVKLDPSKSVIALLKEEDEIEPVYSAFSQIFELKNDNYGIRISPFLSKKRDEIKELHQIYESKFLTPIEKLFLLRKGGFNQFETIKIFFTEIFPHVEDIDFSMEQLFDDTLYPVLKMKEKGVDAWIMQDCISSGMFRTLSQITFLVLAQEGDVILIDEFENGLGVNCINQLAEQILGTEQDLQVIITSHHPYIINSIPFKNWKVVTRECSDVKIMTADELKIGKHSHHEAFMQLIQTRAYRTGKA